MRLYSLLDARNTAEEEQGEEASSGTEGGSEGAAVVGVSMHSVSGGLGEIVIQSNGLLRSDAEDVRLDLVPVISPLSTHALP